MLQRAINKMEAGSSRRSTEADEDQEMHGSDDDPDTQALVSQAVTNKGRRSTYPRQIRRELSRVHQRKFLHARGVDLCPDLILNVILVSRSHERWGLH